MLIDILIAVVMNLSMYIITSTIVNQGNEQQKNYFKDQIEGLRQTIVNTGLQQQQNLLNEVKQGESNIISEIKQSTRKEE